MEQHAENEKKLVLIVTPGNLRQSHLYIRGHHDFFPSDCVGPSRKSLNGKCKPIEIFLDGLGETIETDIGTNATTGKPRAFFRGRSWVRRFFEPNGADLGGIDTEQVLSSQVLDF